MEEDTATTTEEEDKEVVVTVGEDKEESEDEVGGAVGTMTPSWERFKYSRSVGARTSGAYPSSGAARRHSPPAQWKEDAKVGWRQRHRNGCQRRDSNQLTTATMDYATATQWQRRRKRDGDVTATAIEGATEMQW